MTDEKKITVALRMTQSAVDILKTKHNQSAYVEELLTAVESGLLVPKNHKESDKTKKLKDIKLTLECWKMYKELGGIAPQINMLEVLQGNQEMPTLATETLQTVQLVKEVPKSWHHFCKSVGRTVEFQIDIKECKWCGVEQ